MHPVSGEISYYGHVLPRPGFVDNADTNRELILRAVKALKSGAYTKCTIGVVKEAAGAADASDTGDADEHLERVLDVSVRDCATAPARAFLVPEDAPVLQALLPPDVYRLKDFEVLRYSAGVGFSAHTDRVRGEHHIGTLVAVVGSADVEGGELMVSASKRSSVANKQLGGSGVRPYIAFIPLGYTHAVLPVVKGTRYVAKAAVFIKQPFYVNPQVIAAAAAVVKDTKPKPRSRPRPSPRRPLTTTKKHRPIGGPKD